MTSILFINMMNKMFLKLSFYNFIENLAFTGNYCKQSYTNIIIQIQ